jgi:hypothetical protein
VLKKKVIKTAINMRRIKVKTKMGYVMNDNENALLKRVALV